MSNYILKAKNKNTGEVKTFQALDNYFGEYQYGYKDEEGTTYDEDGFQLLYERRESVEANPMEKEKTIDERIDFIWERYSDDVRSVIKEFVHMIFQEKRDEMVGEVEAQLDYHNKKVAISIINKVMK